MHLPGLRFSPRRHRRGWLQASEGTRRLWPLGQRRGCPLTPENNHEGASAPYLDPDAINRELSSGWQMPDDSGVSADGDHPSNSAEAENGPRFTFDELIEKEAAGYRSLN